MLGQHPADELIREFIGSCRAATAGEHRTILDHMASAPFDSRLIRVRPEEQGVMYRGTTLGARADSRVYHLIKRVVLEEQWRDGTTFDEYLVDLRQAILAPSARLAVYERRGGALAATVSATPDAVPEERRGEESLSLLLVVYSVDRGIILTGYQVSELQTARVPEDARWLN